MTLPSPTLEGFRVAFLRPMLTFAEIAWRWTVGAAACVLLGFWFIEYLDTLPVSNGDAALLWTRQPLLVGRAIAHILYGSLNRAVIAALFAVIALALLWIVAASAGRIATVRVLIERFRADVASNVSGTHDSNSSRAFRSLIGLNFLRAAAMLAALLAFVGAAVLVSFVSTSAKPQPALAFILFLPLAGLICTAWSGLNWLLSLAGIFAVSNGEDAVGAISAAVGFFRDNSGSVLAVSTWTGLAHLVAISLASTAVSLPLVFIRVAPRFVVASVIVVMLAYFAVVDWLYIVRLAAYVCITEMPEQLAEAAPLPAPAPQTSIDRDEPILSDIPNLALEP